MKCVKTPLNEIEKTLKLIRAEKILDRTAKIQKDSKYAYIPITKKPKAKLTVIEKEVLRKKTTNFKTEVQKILTEKEKKILVTAYDTVGTIAILEVPEELEKKEKKIAEILLKHQKAIKTVVKKASEHQGELRLQTYKYLAGEKTFETKHKENNTIINLDINKVYFSTRSSSERKRISEKVKKKEEVLVMFSGCAPFVCVIAKNAKPKRVVGIELNKEGHKYGLKNIKENKLKNAELFQGNVKEICKELHKNTFDRIIMPLPKSAEMFLEEALSVSKKGTIIHLYSFSHEKDFPQETIQKIDLFCKKKKIKYEIIDSVLCGNYSPRVHRVCVDFKVLF